jgi:hypothetical protein
MTAPRRDLKADADRQRALDALASLTPPQRAFLQALHEAYFAPRADGGMVYRLVDVLFHLAQGTRYGFSDERIAQALAAPVEYLAVLREATGL